MTKTLFLSFSILTSFITLGQEISPNVWYHIISRSSEKYISVERNGLYQGCAIEQTDRTTEDGQAFRFHEVDNNIYKIELKNKDLVVGVATKSWGQHIVLSKWENEDSQLWSLYETDRGYFTISNLLSGKKWTIDRDRKDNGAWILVWSSDGTQHPYHFKLEPFEGENPLPWENLGKNVNSEISEVSPIVSHDGKVLYFSRGTAKGGRIGNGNIMRSSVDESGMYSRAKRLDSPLNNTKTI